MKRKQTQILSVLVSGLMIVSLLAACGSGTKTAEPTTTTTASTTAAPASTVTEVKAQDPVTLQFFLPPDKPNQMDDVVAEYEKLTKDTLNTKIVFNFVPFSDLANKVAIKLSAGEQVDATFDATWAPCQLTQRVAKDQYVNLDPYFNNDKYPGLKKAFGTQLLKNNSFTNPKGEYHVYGIPFGREFAGAGGMYIRKDLMDKYGISEITSYDQLIAFYDIILKNEKGVVPFGMDGSLQDSVERNIRSMKFVDSAPEAHNYMLDGGNYVLSISGVNIAITPDNKVYVSKSWDDPDFWKLLPDPQSKTDPLESFKTARDWYKKGYVEKDIVSQKNALGMFKAGKFASICAAGANASDTYSSTSAAVAGAIEGASVYFFPLQLAWREGTNGVVMTNFQYWNFVCIPTTSKYADRTMHFFDWIFADQKNHDLFEYGIEGKNWEAVGDDAYKVPDGVDASKNYNLVGFQLTWNPTMMRYDAGMPENIKKLSALGCSEAFLLRNPLTGFTFVPDAVKAELAKINQDISLRKTIELGLVDDIEGNLKKVQEKLDADGYEKLRQEFMKQANEFLAKQK